VTVESGSRRATLVVFGGVAAYRDQHDRTQALVGAQRARDAVAVHAGKADITEHNLRCKGASFLQSVGARVGQVDEMALQFQGLFETRRGITVVLDDQDAPDGDHRGRGRDRDAAGSMTRVRDGDVAGMTLAQFAGFGDGANRSNLSSLHSAKGREFDAVVLFGMNDGRIPRANAGDGERREARRSFYVGFTRAKQELHMMYSGGNPSPFVTEVRDQLEE
jgi:hypothetical protein